TLPSKQKGLGLPSRIRLPDSLAPRSRGDEPRIRADNRRRVRPRLAGFDRPATAREAPSSLDGRSWIEDKAPDAERIQNPKSKIPNRGHTSLSSLPEAIAQERFELGDGIDLPDRRLKIVREAAEGDSRGLDQRGPIGLDGAGVLVQTVLDD